MTDVPRPAPPPGIGPHEGRELDLMLRGEKPLAMFCDVVPSGYDWPDEAFAPHVAAGRIVSKEVLTPTPDGRHTVRYLYYALPDEAWRIDAIHALVATGEQDADRTETEARIGRLLGYRDEDIQTFLRWAASHTTEN
jgi:hypothetical protein